MSNQVSQVLECTATYFDDNDVVCPVCESYQIEDNTSSFQCLDCGSGWKIISLGG